MTEDALDGGDVEAGGEHRAGPGVSKLVRRERPNDDCVEARGAGEDTEAGRDLFASDPSARGGVEEDEILVSDGGRHGAAHFEPAHEGLADDAGDRIGSRLVSFLGNPGTELAVGGGEPGESDAVGLGDTECEALHEPEDCDIAREECRVGFVGGREPGFCVGEDAFYVCQGDELRRSAVEAGSSTDSTGLLRTRRSRSSQR